MEVPENDELSLLLGKDASWTQDVFSVDPCLVEMWEQYRAELAAFKPSVTLTSLEVVQIDCKLLLSNIGLGACLGQPECREGNA